MKTVLKKVKDCRVKLLVEVEPELVENRFQEVFKDFQKVASLPGFRAGKTPLEIIEKKFLKEAQEEVLKSLIPEAYHQSVASQKISPVSLPTIADIQVERGKRLRFSAEFDLFPEFSLKNYKGLKIKKLSMEVSNEDVDKGINSLLNSRAELIEIPNPRPAAKGDFVIADIELWKDNAYVPWRQGTLLDVQPHGGDDFYEKIVGAQVGEVREISIHLTDEEKKQGLIDGKPAYKIWVRGLKTKHSPELNDTLAKSFGKETVDELKEAVRKDIASYKKSESFETMKHELFGKLLQLTDFAVPEALVEKQKEKLVGQAKQYYARMGLKNGELQAEANKSQEEASKKAKEQVKLYFILQKISENEKIEADEIELERKLQALADESKRPLEEARRVFEDDLRESMRESKTIDFLLANAKLEEQSIQTSSSV